MKEQEFLKEEKEHYGKVFVDINYAISNVEPFLDDRRLSERKYLSRLPVLKKYIELIEASERENSKGGFFKIFSSDKHRELLEGYKSDHRKELKQLENCSKCACLNCTVECNFDSCLGCREGSRIVYCDHKRINVIFHDNFTLNLTNERTGDDERYIVLATVQDVVKDKLYIIIEGISTKEKYVLYYYPGISEDTYGEITDEEEFDFVVSTFESVER